MEDTGATPYYNRNAAFSDGLTGAQSQVSPSLALDAERFNAKVPTTVLPSASGNGMSAGQYETTMGGELPTQNAIATNQYEVARFSMRKV